MYIWCADSCSSEQERGDVPYRGNTFEKLYSSKSEGTVSSELGVGHASSKAEACQGKGIQIHGGWEEAGFYFPSSDWLTDGALYLLSLQAGRRRLQMASSGRGGG